MPGASFLTRHESLYLDLMRSLAAASVVFDHAPTLFPLPHMIRWGHHAVMLFFVLSGYVICHVADTRERTPGAFLVSRLSRLWSVLVPAIALTVVCDVAGRRFGLHPAAYAGTPFDHPLVRVAAVLGFVSESWVSIQPLSNGVVWSLCVEFWYYMVFAAAVFVPRGRWRVVAVSACLLMGGHKAILLLPVWLMGVALQRSRAIRRLPAWANTVLWAASLLVIAWVLAARVYDVPIAATRQVVPAWLWTQLAQARVFWFDWMFGLVVAAHLLGARTVSAWLRLERVAGVVRWCAGVSFATYLFHEPLLHFWAAFLAQDQGWLAIALTFAVIALLGPPVERSRGWWKRSLARVGSMTSRQRPGHHSLLP